MRDKTHPAGMIAVYGATGHTGRLVARELCDRGHTPLLLGRDSERLAALRSELPASALGQAMQADEIVPGALAGAAAVINCAGPFAHTAPAVAGAAVQADCHYVDVTAEPPVVQELWDAHGKRASDRGVAVVCAAGFYCALADCLANSLVGGRGRQDEITVAYRIDGWRMTRASRETATELAQKPRLAYTGGRLTTEDPMPDASTFRFPEDDGEQAVIAYPGSEVLTLPRHVETDRIRVVMTSSTFNAETFNTEDIAAGERARSRFFVVVEAASAQESPRAWVSGQDIYRVGGVTAVETALRLTRGEQRMAGPLAPAEILESDALFGRLRECGLTGSTAVASTAGAGDGCDRASAHSAPM